MESLRQHPFVLSWIAEYQKDPWCKHPDCSICGFPHSEVLLCNGATFGLLHIGGETYTVDVSNVASRIHFREQIRQGFHWRDIYFQRMDDGSVQITSFWNYNNYPQERKWTIPSEEWASIISSVSATGETTESYQQALKFHGNERLTSIVRIARQSEELGDYDKFIDIVSEGK